MMTVVFSFADGITIKKALPLSFCLLDLEKAAKTIKAVSVEILSVNP